MFDQTEEQLAVLEKAAVAEGKQLKVEVIADDSGNWATNGLRFGTTKEAVAYGHDLAGRWVLVRRWRVAIDEGDTLRLRVERNEMPNYVKLLTPGRRLQWLGADSKQYIATVIAGGPNLTILGEDGKAMGIYIEQVSEIFLPGLTLWIPPTS